VTVTSRQKQPHAQVERELRLPAVEGIAPLRSVGPIDDEHDAMAEEEPAGRPASELPLPLWPGDAVELAAQVAAVLERVHAAGAVLRFLRPELVYLELADGRPHLTGIAPRADLFVIGASAAYGAQPLFHHLFAAPEVLAMHKGITPAADVFSLCAALAVWLTGEHPFEGETVTAQLGAIAGGRGRPWRGPAELGMVLAAGLERAPRARPSLPALVRDLRAAAGEH
jgi:serine/threonine protein kinase